MKKEAFNYRIIHDAAYYEENSLKDEYLASDSDTIRQNITIEGVEEVSDAIAKTLIKEQLVKRDLQEQKIKPLTEQAECNRYVDICRIRRC